jgi:anti-sigma regulatory factor (Ser/Thr protein kinase)
MANTKPLRLHLDAEAASIGQARSAVAQLGTRLGMGATTLDDLRTAVSEACSNVVLHAYPHGDGSFEIEATPKPSELEVVVRDHGQGLRPRVRSNGSSLGLGLGLISTLSSRFEIRARGEGGTEVVFALPLCHC